MDPIKEAMIRHEDENGPPEERIAKHTPGPWNFLEQDYAPAVLQPRPWTICDADCNDLANIYSDENATVLISRNASIANAHLIAAAPDMLAEHHNIGIGGNHLANILIQKLGPDFATKYPPDLDADSALHMLCATTEYDVWCCWAAIMRARPVVDKAEGRTP